MNNTLYELRAEQEKLKDKVNKEPDIQLLRADLKKERDDMEAEIRLLRADVQFLRVDMQSIKADLERQRKCGEVKESSLSAQLEKQKSDGVEKDSDNQQNMNGTIMETKFQQLKADFQSQSAELEKQKKDGVEKDMNIQQLEAKLKLQIKYEVEIQSLRTELERQKKLTVGMIYPPSCTEAKSNGIYTHIPNFSGSPFTVTCDAETQGGGWTIILRRMDGSVNFFRNWTEYKNGFGDLDGEFFLGLDKIHALTAERRQELLVILKDSGGEERYETYDNFAIGNEDQQYTLYSLGEASGTAGDSLKVHMGMKFSTFDRENDKNVLLNCAEFYTGAWWFNNCGDSKLTGKYNDNTYGRGINWSTFSGWYYSLKTAVMMIRPKK
ncbi:microfibril-associated glycoprotein 4-like [Drosophila innubila]|uniref:microfibril-associated glycoprotein 4-like n=1 Tax=Drosophila innubila TaxID=198719 RepID=UPI00148BB99A|nr:microfibril-associated glycoprotein 4-like [Drosophila innubila]